MKTSTYLGVTTGCGSWAMLHTLLHAAAPANYVAAVALPIWGWAWWRWSRRARRLAALYEQASNIARQAIAAANADDIEAAVRHRERFTELAELIRREENR